MGSKKLYKMPIANALSVFVEPINESTGYTCKRIVGNDRWFDPIKKKKVQVPVPLGVYGKDITLKEARELWLEIRREAKATGRDPREIMRKESLQNRQTFMRNRICQHSEK